MFQATTGIMALAFRRECPKTLPGPAAKPSWQCLLNNTLNLKHSWIIHGSSRNHENSWIIHDFHQKYLYDIFIFVTFFPFHLKLPFPAMLTQPTMRCCTCLADRSAGNPRATPVLVESRRPEAGPKSKWPVLHRSHRRKNEGVPKAPGRSAEILHRDDISKPQCVWGWP